jgi:hypothetical protein
MPSRPPVEFDRTQADRLFARGVPPTEGRIAERGAWFEARSFSPRRQSELLPSRETPTQIG